MVTTRASTTPREASVTASAPADAPATARRFLSAVARRDFDELEVCLAPNVWFRALQPRRIREETTAGETVAAYRLWFETPEEIELLETQHYSMAGREYLRYRFLLRPEWKPEQWHVIEQAGFCRVKDGRISRIDLVCTGFFATERSEWLSPSVTAAA